MIEGIENIKDCHCNLSIAVTKHHDHATYKRKYFTHYSFRGLESMIGKQNISNRNDGEFIP